MAQKGLQRPFGIDLQAQQPQIKIKKVQNIAIKTILLWLQKSCRQTIEGLLEIRNKITAMMDEIIFISERVIQQKQSELQFQKDQFKPDSPINKLKQKMRCLSEYTSVIFSFDREYGQRINLILRQDKEKRKQCIEKIHKKKLMKEEKGIVYDENAIMQQLKEKQNEENIKEKEVKDYNHEQ